MKEAWQADGRKSVLQKDWCRDQTHVHNTQARSFGVSAFGTIACVHHVLRVRVVVFWAIQILVIQKCITSRKYAADRSFQICLFLILFTPSTVLTCQLGATTTWNMAFPCYLFVGKMVSTGCSGKIQLALTLAKPRSRVARHHTNSKSINHINDVWCFLHIKLRRQDINNGSSNRG